MIAPRDDRTAGVRQDRGRVEIQGFREREHPAEELDALFSQGWPPWIDADAVAAEHLPAVRSRFGHLERAVLVDGVLTAAGWGVPVRWDGTTADLPGGYDGSLVRAVSDDATADTLVVCAAQVRSDATGRGLAGRLIADLVEVGTRLGLHRVIAPLRPTGKHRYPLTPIEEYVRWRRPDGSALDPWVRTHERLGATVLGTVAASQVFEAAVAQWQEWTGLALAATGEHVLPAAPDVLHVDAGAGRAVLREPGIWVRHR